MPVEHRNLTDAEIHAIGFVQAGDPGAIGAGKVWVDTSGGTGLWVVKVRNAADSGWETMSTGAGSAQKVFFGTFADPTGNVTAIRPAMYYNDVGNLYVKTNATEDTAGWNKLL